MNRRYWIPASVGMLGLYFLLPLVTPSAPAQTQPKPQTRPAASASAAPTVKPASAVTPVTAVTPVKPGTPSAGTIEVLFTYGSEKQKWVEAVTPEFNAAGLTISTGQRVVVKPVPVGSGEIVSEVIDGIRQPHLVSPASRVFLSRGNARWRETHSSDLFDKVDDKVDRELVSSPVVVAMWREMAEAIGWPQKPIRWKDIFNYASDPAAWKQKQTKENETFRFGHTHPDYSNSGLLALFAETYAALGKFDKLSRGEVVQRKDQVVKFIKNVENSVVHYGESTGFFGKRMYQEGKGYLSAAILYENMVIEANQALREKAAKEKKEKGLAVEKDDASSKSEIVAIYPAEGTFACEHPAAVVQREWVTAAHKEAALKYVDFLRDRPQQEKALKYGLRPYPNDKDPIPLSDLWVSRNGVRRETPKRLEYPPASAVNLILDTWKNAKRHSDVVLVIDTSASMEGEKIKNAEEGARAFIDMFAEGNTLSTIIFGSEVEWLMKGVKTDKAGREELKTSIKDLLPFGDTALYDAISQAHNYLEQLRLERGEKAAERTQAIVVLSDGKDTRDKPTREELLSSLQGGGSKGSTFIFTIGYGTDADKETLELISKATRGEYFPGKIEDIRKVFTKIAVYF